MIYKGGLTYAIVYRFDFTLNLPSAITDDGSGRRLYTLKSVLSQPTRYPEDPYMLDNLYVY